MKASVSPALVEAYVLLEFATMLLAVVLLPMMGLTALNLAVLVVGGLLTLATAFAYALFALHYEPPLGARLVRWLGAARPLR